MKTKFLLIVAGLSLLTGCFYYAPKTIKYNGETYKTDWCLSMPSNGREYYPCIKYDETKILELANNKNIIRICG